DLPQLELTVRPLGPSGVQPYLSVTIRECDGYSLQLEGLDCLTHINEPCHLGQASWKRLLSKEALASACGLPNSEFPPRATRSITLALPKTIPNQSQKLTLRLTGQDTKGRPIVAWADAEIQLPIEARGPVKGAQ